MEIELQPIHFIVKGPLEKLPTLKELALAYVNYVLTLKRGQKTSASLVLGINRRTLYRRKRHDMRTKIGSEIQTEMEMTDNGNRVD